MEEISEVNDIDKLTIDRLPRLINITIYLMESIWHKLKTTNTVIYNGYSYGGQKIINLSHTSIRYIFSL